MSIWPLASISQHCAKPPRSMRPSPSTTSQDTENEAGFPSEPVASRIVILAMLPARTYKSVSPDSSVPVVTFVNETFLLVSSLRSQSMFNTGPETSLAKICQRPLSRSWEPVARHATFPACKRHGLFPGPRIAAAIVLGPVGQHRRELSPGGSSGGCWQALAPIAVANWKCGSVWGEATAVPAVRTPCFQGFVCFKAERCDRRDRSARRPRGRTGIQPIPRVCRGIQVCFLPVTR